METGTVKWFSNRRGYGFISLDNGEEDVFVHFSGIGGEDYEYKTLNKGDEVQFEIEQDEKGPKAVNVTITRKAPQEARVSLGESEGPERFGVSYGYGPF